MRNRLLVGVALRLRRLPRCSSWIFIRAITRPLQSMTRTAERLARGRLRRRRRATDAGGELGVLARAMTQMAGEVKARVGELTEQRDLLSVVFGGLVEGVVVVDRDGAIVLVNDAAQAAGRRAASCRRALAPLVDARARRRAGRRRARAASAARCARARARSRDARGAIVVLYDVTRHARARGGAPRVPVERRARAAHAGDVDLRLRRDPARRRRRRRDLAGVPRRRSTATRSGSRRWSPTCSCSTRSAAAPTAVGERAPVAARRRSSAMPRAPRRA